MVNNSSIREDIKFLESWLELVKERISEIRKISKEKTLKSYFSIGTTSTLTEGRPYLTPIRFLEDGVVSGVIVFSQIQAMLAANVLKAQVDYVLIDTEKKMGIQVDVDLEVLKYFNIKSPNRSKKSRANIEMGNVSSAVRVMLSDLDEERLIEYKPNDITVNSVWSFLSLKTKNLSGKKIAILGCGNIGSKLALKLVESGVNVEIVRRDAVKGIQIANAINTIKPDTTIARASFNPSCLQASLFCDVLIGATSNPVITWDMIQSMAPHGFVIDLGKGSVTEEALAKSLESGIEVSRTDITAALYGFISHKQQMQKILKNKVGRKLIDDKVYIISGGILGKSGEVIVDNYSSPSFVHGVSDGKGNIRKLLSEEDNGNIEYIKQKYNIK
jgi:hypothetical protein